MAKRLDEKESLRTNVLLAPERKIALLSTGKITDRGFKMIFHDGGALIQN